jgi:hypothetical protein
MTQAAFVGTPDDIVPERFEPHLPSRTRRRVEWR